MSGWGDPALVHSTAPGMSVILMIGDNSTLEKRRDLGREISTKCGWRFDEVLGDGTGISGRPPIDDMMRSGEHYFIVDISDMEDAHELWKDVAEEHKDLDVVGIMQVNGESRNDGLGNAVEKLKTSFRDAGKFDVAFSTQVSDYVCQLGHQLLRLRSHRHPEMEDKMFEDIERLNQAVEELRRDLSLCDGNVRVLHDKSEQFQTSIERVAGRLTDREQMFLDMHTVKEGLDQSLRAHGVEFRGLILQSEEKTELATANLKSIVQETTSMHEMKAAELQNLISMHEMKAAELENLILKTNSQLDECRSAMHSALEGADAALRRDVLNFHTEQKESHESHQALIVELESRVRQVDGKVVESHATLAREVGGKLREHEVLAACDDLRKRLELVEQNLLRHHSSVMRLAMRGAATRSSPSQSPASLRELAPMTNS